VNFGKQSTYNFGESSKSMWTLLVDCFPKSPEHIIQPPLWSRHREAMEAMEAMAQGPETLPW
jgi:hypothetical protein